VGPELERTLRAPVRPPLHASSIVIEIMSVNLESAVITIFTMSQYRTALDSVQRGAEINSTGDDARAEALRLAVTAAGKRTSRHMTPPTGRLI
jgi:hypothetical protein